MFLRQIALLFTLLSQNVQKRHFLGHDVLCSFLTLPPLSPLTHSASPPRSLPHKAVSFSCSGALSDGSSATVCIKHCL